jgi:hypothetical protein
VASAYRITRNPDLVVFVDSLTGARDFARENGPGRYQIDEQRCGLSVDATTSWGTIIHDSDGQILSVLAEHRPNDPDERVRRAAYHEAGHAALYLEVGRSVERVEISPDDQAVGGTTFVTQALSKPVSSPAPSATQVKEFLLDLECLAAGSASELVAFPGSPLEPLTIRSGDVDQMMSVLEGLALDNQSREDMIISAFVRALERLRQPRLWVQVQALAEVLIDRGELNGSEVTEIRERVISRL